MPFKSNYGSTSAKTSWGQWASFSLGLGKLSGYQGRTPSISQPYQGGIKEETDWLNVASGVLSGLNAVADEYEKDVSKDVDKYLKSHSLQEYQDHIKAKGLPFQNDPIAMKVFKTKYGSIYSGLAETEFQQRIQDGDFKGLSESELDAEHYKFMREKLSEINDDTQGEFSGKVFEESFWAQSPANRLSAMKMHQKREQGIKLQEDKNANIALFQQGLEDGTVHDTASALNGFSLMYNSGGYHQTPDSWEGQLKEHLQAIAESPNGAEILKGLIGKDMVGLQGRKFDKALIDPLITKAVAYKASQDASAKYAFSAGVNELVKKDDLTTVNQMLSDMLKANGDVKTWQTEELFKAGEEIKKNRFALQKKALGEAKKAQDKAEAFINCEKYWKAAVKGVVPPAGQKGVVGFTENQFKEWFTMARLNGLISDDEIVAVAGNTSVEANNPAARYLNTYSTHGLSLINGYINNTQTEIPDDEHIPMEIQLLGTYYAKDPNVFHQVVARTGNKSTEAVGSILMAKASGISFQEIIHSMRDLNKLKGAQDYNSKSTRENLLNLISKEVGDYEDFYSRNYLLTSSASAIVHTGLKADKAFEAAKNQLLSSHTKFRGTFIPNNLLSASGLNNNDLTTKLLDENIESLKKPVGSVRFNMMRGTIDVIGQNYVTVLKRYTMEDLKTLGDEFTKKQTGDYKSWGVTKKTITKTLNNPVEGGSD